MAPATRSRQARLSPARGGKIQTNVVDPKLSTEVTRTDLLVIILKMLTLAKQFLPRQE
jgi:hypothetical protein